MSYSTVQYFVAYEYNGTGGWTAVLSDVIRGYDTARRYFDGTKEDEISKPYLYRKIRLLQQTTTVFDVEDISP